MLLNLFMRSTRRSACHPFHPRFWLLTALSLGFGARAFANPQGLTVQSGTATTSTSGSQLNINTSQNATLNWQTFNVGNGETTTFHQPSINSVVWNQINDQNPDRKST